MTEALNKFLREHPNHAAPWTLSVNSHAANAFLQLTAHTIASEDVKGVKKKKVFVFHFDFVESFETKSLLPKHTKMAEYISFARRRYTTAVTAAINVLENVQIVPAIILADANELGQFSDDFNLAALPAEHFSRSWFAFLFGAILKTPIPATAERPKQYMIQFFGEAFYIGMNSFPALKFLLDDNTVQLFNAELRKNYRWNADIFSEHNERLMLAAVKEAIPPGHEDTWHGRQQQNIPGMLAILRKIFRMMRVFWQRQVLIDDEEIAVNSIQLIKCFDDVAELLNNTRISFRKDTARARPIADRGHIAQRYCDSVRRTLSTYRNFLDKFPRAHFNTFSLHYEYELGTYFSPITDEKIATRLATGMKYLKLKKFPGDPVLRFLSLWCGWSLMEVEYVPIIVDENIAVALLAFLKEAKKRVSRVGYVRRLIDGILMQKEIKRQSR